LKFLETLTENAVKSWITTVIGTIVALAGIASPFALGATWTEAAAIITLGIGLVLAPDKYIKKK
jgi:hypothetical protein